MACECEYALRTLAKTFTVHSNERWVRRKISYDLTAHCPSGHFPASRCISTCILFCFSVTIHKHTMINMYCGTQKHMGQYQLLSVLAVRLSPLNIDHSRNLPVEICGIN